jgi:GAF domain-containing protein
MNRERSLADTFVEFADTLVEGFDVVDFLFNVAQRCVEILDASQAGVMLGDQNGELQLVAATNDSVTLLELFELQNSAGPCLDCWRSGNAVISSDLSQSDERWAPFVEKAIAMGFHSVYAVPMRLRGEIIGALNLFRGDTSEWSEQDIKTGQALADVATIAIIQERALRESHLLAEQLQYALNARVVIEQAKGVVSERRGVDMNAAFTLLRSHARNQNMKLIDLANAVVEGRVSVGDT